MFSLKRLDDLADGVAEPLSLLNTRVLEALGRRIALAKSGGFDRLSTLTSAEKEADALYTAILRELGETSVSADEVFAEAAKIAYKNANRFYTARGIKQLPIEYRAGLINFVLGVAQTTKQTFTNLSNSSAIGFRVLNADGSVRYTGFKEQYLRLVDQAIAEVATGQKDYGSALRHAMKQTADSGIRLVDYQSGYSRRLDSAMRQSVLDGVKDIAHEVATRTGEEFGADGVEIDAHNYCAEDHLPYQGKQFKKAEFDEIQDSLPRQFGMWSCRHTYYPIILGLSEPLYTEDERQAMIAQSTEKIEFEGKQYTRYEATQLQRRIETSVRQSKDRAVIAKAAGDDLSRRVEQARINQLKDKYVDLSKKFGLPYASERMSVSGFRQVSPKPPMDTKTIGFTWYKKPVDADGFTTIEQATALGNSDRGWDYHEKVFKKDYLKPFNLRDDVEWTHGYWGAVEPSFNAKVSGSRGNLVSMMKQWGKDYNQDAMVALVPSKAGKGGKLVWDFTEKLTSNDENKLFRLIDDAYQEASKTGKSTNFGITDRGHKTIEYWFNNENDAKNGLTFLGDAVNKLGLQADFEIEVGYEFILLLLASDY